MAEQLNMSAIGDDVLMNAPPVTAGAPASLPEAHAETPAQPVLYDDATSSRHGRVAARSINMGFKAATGEGLDSDTSQTLGDVLGEMFGLASRHVNRLVYIAMLGMCVVPLIAVVLLKVLKPEAAQNE